MNDIAYRRARARVEAQLGFYRHAGVYVLVNLFLAILNLTRSPEELWFQWPLPWLGNWTGLSRSERFCLPLEFGPERTNDPARDGT